MLKLCSVLVSRHTRWEDKFKLGSDNLIKNIGCEQNDGVSLTLCVPAQGKYSHLDFISFSIRAGAGLEFRGAEKWKLKP